MSSLKFAIVTDTHLGYEETDSNLQNDSFDAFDEALKIAHDENVDFILHAGDMFNSSSPSPSTIVKTNKILLEYTFTIPNDLEQKNPYRCTDANGEVNIKCPMFVISGNHDQPSGMNLTSPCEIPSSCNLVYYFEKFIDNPVFNLKPVMIERGNLTIAVYGLAYINNDHFISLLKNTIDSSGSPTLEFDNPPPEEDSGSNNRRYNILLVHQDRPLRANKSSEAAFSLAKICPWMDLIVWGHEHDNKKSIEKSHRLNIIQPGSTIITQYRKYEEPKRGIDIIEVSSDDPDIQFRNIELETPRSYIYGELDLTKIRNFNILDSKSKENQIRDKISELLDQNTNQEKLPIVRLCIISSPSIVFNDVPYKQVCFEFSDKVANPNSIINISKRKDTNAKASSNTTKETPSKEPDFNSSPSTVEDSLSQAFREAPLEILLVDTLNQSLNGFITQNDKNIFDRNVKGLIDDRVKFLVDKIQTDEKGLSPDEAAKLIEKNKKCFPPFSSPDHITPPRNSRRKNVNDDDSDDDSETTTTTRTSRGRGRGRGGRKVRAETEVLSDIDEKEDDEAQQPLPPKKSKPPRKRPPPTIKSVQEFQ